MKILFTINLLPHFDGTTMVLKKLSETLYDFGHESIVLINDIKSDIKFRIYKNYKVIKVPVDPVDFIIKKLYLKNKFVNLLDLIKRKVSEVETRIISKISRFAEKHSFTILWGLFLDSFGWKLLLKLLIMKTKDIDVIITSPVGRACITASLIAAKIKKIPIIIIPAYHFMIKDYTINDKNWAEILKKFNLIITYTYAELTYLNNIGISKKFLKSIGAGVPFHEINRAGKGDWREKLEIPKSSYVILYLNTPIRDLYKGIEAVIKAAIKMPSIFFIFVGRYEREWIYLKKKYELETLNNIFYIEFISDKEKYQLLNTVDLIVKPSYNDSFGLVFFEGICAGKPIITSDIEAMIEISKNVGLSVPFNDEFELIRSIKRLKEDKVLYNKFSKNALDKAKNYSWLNIAKKYELVIKSLIKK